MPVAPALNKWLAASGAVGTGGVIAQTVLPDASAWERLGVAGLLVIAAYFMIRYFMGVVERKDVQIQSMMKEQGDRQERQTAIIVEHLRMGYTVHDNVAKALNELTIAVRLRKDNPVLPLTDRRDGS